MEQQEKYWCKLEKIYVHNVYESISAQYDEFLKLNQLKLNNDKENETSGKINTDLIIAAKPHHLLLGNNSKKKLKLRTDNKPWPKVTDFLLQLEPYSLVADIGCGDGKYLNLNRRIMCVGVDRSTSLCNLATVKYQPFVSSLNNQNQIVVSDNLGLPFRSNLFDAVVSIGVIHHFSTPKRRIQAINELCRILKPGGKCMIYVWAMEQRTRKFNGQDVLVPMIDVNLNNKSSYEPKIILRRNLSNNSSFNSEDSNDESISSPNKSILAEPPAAAGATSPQMNENDICENNDEIVASNKPVSDEEEDEVVVEISSSSKSTIMSNVKQFLTKRFSSSTHLKTSASISNKLSRMYSNPPPSAASVSNFQQLITSFNNSNSEAIERYKQIIEDHRHILPKGFTLRQFPYSSCQESFDDEIKPIKPIATTSQYDDDDGSDDKKQEEEAPNAIIQEDEQDDDNALKKRFYHVFKRDELNDLIKEHCVDLIISTSYNDHGNWCWVGTKRLISP